VNRDDGPVTAASVLVVLGGRIAFETDDRTVGRLSLSAAPA
jgi:hypothetical protein